MHLKKESRWEILTWESKFLFRSGHAMICVLLIYWLHILIKENVDTLWGHWMQRSPAWKLSLQKSFFNLWNEELRKPVLITMFSIKKVELNLGDICSKTLSWNVKLSCRYTFYHNNTDNITSKKIILLLMMRKSWSWNRELWHFINIC